MPITYTGRSVKPDGATHPSLIDIAVGISRQPRFAGQGKRWFSVLDHSLFCDELVQRNPSVSTAFGSDDIEARRNWQLAMLLHDAHEAITADVPTDFKSPALSMFQGDLDREIYGTFYPRYYYNPSEMAPAIKHIDRRALVAEAHVIGPPVEKERILAAFGANDDMHDDIMLLEKLLEYPWFGEPPFEHLQEDHPGVRTYLGRIMELL